MTAPLLSELTRAQGTDFDQYLPQVVAGLGIPLPTIIALCGVLPIRRYAGDLFEVDDDGEPELIVAVAEESEIVDLLALMGRRDWLLRVGAGVLLGFDEATGPAMGEPLRIWRSPFSWLRSGGNGCCVVGSWDVARQHLPQGRQLVAEDVAHARELDERLSYRPRVLIERPASQAA